MTEKPYLTQTFWLTENSSPSEWQFIGKATLSSLLFLLSEMTIQQFCNATHYVQRTILKMHGIYLLTKKSGDNTSFLYQVDDFYVEVVKPDLPNQMLLIKSFSVTEKALDDYLCMVDLSSIHCLLE